MSGAAGVSDIDGRHEGAGKGKPGRVGHRPVFGGKRGVALQPAGRILLDHIGEDGRPFLDDLPVRFEMELSAVAGAADAEGLVLGGAVGGEPYGPLR